MQILDSHRGGRLLLGAVVAFLLLAASGCTTSKAVRAWHDGWRAEVKGDYEKAAKRYAWAYGRDGGLVGAELGRLRLLARQPDQVEAANKGLKTLLKKKGARVSVQLFGTGWALAQGDLPLAKKRLATINRVAIEKADAPFLAARQTSQGKRNVHAVTGPVSAGKQPVSGESSSGASLGGAAPSAAARADARLGPATIQSAKPSCGPFTINWQRLRLRVLSRTADYAGAKAAAQLLVARCGAGSPDVALDRARTQLGLGDARRARRVLARGRSGKNATNSAQTRAFSAEVAFALDEPKRVERLVLRRTDARALSLRAWAAWRSGKYRRAVARATRAIRKDTKQTLAVEVQVAAAISGNELELAEGVLRGAASLLGMDEWTLAFAEGILAVRSGKLGAAERAFQRAVARCPTCPAPRKNLAVLRRALGTQPTVPNPIVRPKP